MRCLPRNSQKKPAIIAKSFFELIQLLVTVGTCINLYSIQLSYPLKFLYISYWPTSIQFRWRSGQLCSTGIQLLSAAVSLFLGLSNLDFLLLGSYTRLLCPLIKLNSQMAKIHPSLPHPLPLLLELANKLCSC